MPRVVGFLLLGLLLGPEQLNIVPISFVENSNLIIDLSLAIIALLIGSTLKVSELKTHMKEVGYITLFQSLLTFVVVALGFFFLAEYLLSIDASDVLIFSLVIASIATATFSHNKGMETISTIGLLFVVYSASEHFNLEPILSAMVMGFFMSNTSNDFDFLEEEIDAHLIDIIFMLFFVVSAMHLRIDSISSFFWIISAYIVLRAIGKISGGYIGASISHSDEFTKKHIGFALLPQAGVAIGLALSIQQDVMFENISYLVLNVVIATTLIHELFGPIITEYIIKKSGDVKEENLDKS